MTGTALPTVSAKLLAHLKIVAKFLAGDAQHEVDEDSAKCVIKAKSSPSGAPALLDISAVLSGSGTTAAYTFEWDSADSVALRALLDAAVDLSHEYIVAPGGSTRPLSASFSAASGTGGSGGAPGTVKLIRCIAAVSGSVEAKPGVGGTGGLGGAPGVNSDDSELNGDAGAAGSAGSAGPAGSGTSRIEQSRCDDIDISGTLLLRLSLYLTAAATTLTNENSHDIESL